MDDALALADTVILGVVGFCEEEVVTFTAIETVENLREVVVGNEYDVDMLVKIDDGKIPDAVTFITGKEVLPFKVDVAVKLTLAKGAEVMRADEVLVVLLHSGIMVELEALEVVHFSVYGVTTPE